MSCQALIHYCSIKTPPCSTTFDVCTFITTQYCSIKSPPCSTTFDVCTFITTQSNRLLIRAYKVLCNVLSEFICSLQINPYTGIEFTHFVTPGVAPTVQALHLFKLFMMLENNVTRTFIRSMNLKRHVTVKIQSQNFTSAINPYR